MFECQILQKGFCIFEGIYLSVHYESNQLISLQYSNDIGRTMWRFREEFLLELMVYREYDC